MEGSHNAASGTLEQISEGHGSSCDLFVLMVNEFTFPINMLTDRQTDRQTDILLTEGKSIQTYLS